MRRASPLAGAPEHTSALPNGTQERALRVALALDPSECAAGFAGLRSLLPGVGGPDPNDLRSLFPMLAWNLSRHNVRDSWTSESRAAIARAAIEVAIAHRTTRVALHALREVEIDVIGLKGLSLGLTAYEAPHLRPLTDVDLLVPPHDAVRAFDALDRAGFSGRRVPRRARDLRRNHAVPIRRSELESCPIDLHWHLLATARSDKADHEFWRTSRLVRFGRTTLRILGPTEQLFHILVHGARWTQAPHARWVADAALVLRRDGAKIDVARLVDLARMFDVIVTVREALRCVVRISGEGEDLFERFRSLRAGAFNERAFRARATGYIARSPLDRATIRIENARHALESRRRRSG